MTNTLLMIIRLTMITFPQVFSLLVALALSGPLTSLHSPGVSLSLAPGHIISGASSAVHVVKR